MLNIERLELMKMKEIFMNSKNKGMHDFNLGELISDTSTQMNFGQNTNLEILKQVDNESSFYSDNQDFVLSNQKHFLSNSANKKLAKQNKQSPQLTHKSFGEGNEFSLESEKIFF